MVGKNKFCSDFGDYHISQRESKHARAKRHASLETKQIKAPVPLSWLQLFAPRWKGFEEQCLNDALPKQQQFIGIPSASCFLGVPVSHVELHLQSCSTMIRMELPTTQEKRQNGRYGTLPALWRCCEIVLDQSTASTSVGQFSPKNGQAGPKHMNTRGNLIKGALCIWAF